LKDKFSGKFIVLDGPDGCGKTVQLELLSTYLKNEGIPVVQTNDPGGTKIGNQISRLLKYDAQGAMDVQTEVMLFMASRAQLAAEIIKPSLETGKTILCDRYISSTCAYQGSSGYPVEKIIELGKVAVGDAWPDLTIIIDISVEEGLERTGRKPYQKTKVNHKDANQSYTCAYQGSSGYPVEKIIELGKAAVGDAWPDLTIIIDISVEEGLERTGRKPYQKTKVNHNDANQSYLFKNVVVDRFDSRPLEYHRKVRKGFLKLAQYYPGIVKIVDGSQGDIETVHKKILELISEVSFT